MTRTRIAGAPADEEGQETLKRVVAVYGFLSTLRQEVRASAPNGPSFTALEPIRIPTTSDRTTWRPRSSSSSSSSSVSSERSFLF